MKVKTVSAITGFCYFIILTASGQNDIEAIKGVIERETTSFFAVDREGWEVNWANTSYSYWSLCDSAGGSYVEGIENIKKNFDEYFNTAKPSKSKIDRVWLEVRLYGKGAYVRFIQKVAPVFDTPTFSKTLLRQPANIVNAWHTTKSKLATSAQLPGLDFKKWTPGGNHCYSVRVTGAVRAHLRFDKADHNWYAEEIGGHKALGHG